jgi:hypothetical protein
MKQTAVQWLENELQEYFFHGNGTLETILKQAKEMEKEQMRLADKNGQDRNQYKHDCRYGGVEYWDNEPKSFEEYYNETFNTKEK